jgi:signal peptidase
LQYSIDKSRKDMPSRLIVSLNPKRWITSLVINLFAIAFIAGLFPLSPVVILSGSMEPSIRPGDLVIIRRCGIDEKK